MKHNRLILPSKLYFRDKAIHTGLFNDAFLPFVITEFDYNFFARLRSVTNAVYMTSHKKPAYEQS